MHIGDTAGAHLCCYWHFQYVNLSLCVGVTCKGFLVPALHQYYLLLHHQLSRVFFRKKLILISKEVIKFKDKYGNLLSSRVKVMTSIDIHGF